MTLVEKIVCAGIAGTGMAAVIAAAKNIVNFVQNSLFYNPDFVNIAQEVEGILSQIN